MPRPVKAFISYSHDDRAALTRLEKHLAILQRDKLLSAWFDREIPAGGALDAQISTQLEACDLFIALVSPDFLASRYCFEIEMQRAIARHGEGNLIVVPVIIEPCEWLATPLKKFKALPEDGKPVSDWTNANTAYLNIASALLKLIERTTETAGLW